MKIGEITSWSQVNTADCAVVLTGGAFRVREGFDLLSQGKIRLLIVSGVNPSAHHREIFPLWPFYPGLTEPQVYLEKISNTTYGNAVQSLEVVKKKKCESIFLVTSQVHMPRAYGMFKSVFPSQFKIVPHAVPAGSGEEQTADLLYEVIKTIVNRHWFST